MANAQKTIMVFVARDWFDDTLRIVIREPRSTSTTPYHVLYGELRDHTLDPAGVWFSNVPNPQAGAGAVMEFLVPWKVIQGVGLMPTTTPPVAIDDGENRAGCTILKWPDLTTPG